MSVPASDAITSTALSNELISIYMNTDLVQVRGMTSNSDTYTQQAISDLEKIIELKLKEEYYQLGLTLNEYNQLGLSLEPVSDGLPLVDILLKHQQAIRTMVNQEIQNELKGMSEDNITHLKQKMRAEKLMKCFEFIRATNKNLVSRHSWQDLNLDVNVILKLSPELLKRFFDLGSDNNNHTYCIGALLREVPLRFSIDNIGKLGGTRLGYTTDKKFTAEQVMHPKFSSEAAEAYKKGKGKFEELCNLAPYQVRALSFDEADSFSHQKPLTLREVTHQNFSLKHCNMMMDLGLSFNEVITLNISELRDLEEGVPFAVVQKANKQRLGSLESKGVAEVVALMPATMVTFSSTGSAVSGAGSAAGSAASTDNAQTVVETIRQVDASTEKKQEKKITKSS